MSALENLSDVEFESLVADLLRAGTGIGARVFQRAADGGVDLRYADGDVVDITQCKHYVNSSFSQLLAAAKREKTNVDDLAPTPTRYRFVTSRKLTLRQTEQIADALSPWIADVQDVWDGNEVERLLLEHDHVQRQHVKLWLANGAALGALLRAATHQRSQALVDAVREVLPRYVQTQRFFEAQTILADTGTCLIAGEPGIGKTTMAQMLLLDLSNQGFEPLQVSADADEAWDALDERHRQAFYYDDFIGRSAVGERLAKNEDHRLVELIRYAARHPNAVRLILTTREYILREATALYETFKRADLDANRFLLELPDYTRSERAQIFYNHVYHSGRLTHDQLRNLVTNRAYLNIIDHPYYNPRVIEYITGLSGAADLPAAAKQDYVAFAIHALDHPDQIWDHAFRRELNEHQQALLLLMATMPPEVRLGDLRRAFDSTYDTPRLAFAHALRTLEVTFLRIGHDHTGADVVEFVNPSVQDFLGRVLAQEPGEVRTLLRGAIGTEQVEALWNLGRTRADERYPSPLMRTALKEHRSELAAAVIRVSGAQTLGRPTTTEDWLAFAVRARGLGAEARAALDPWLDQQLTECAARWADERGSRRAAVELLSTLLRHGMRRRAGQMIPVAKRWLTDSASDPEDYDLLDDLRRLGDDVFGADEWQHVLTGFQQLMEETLTWGEPDEADLDRLEEIANTLGIYYDDDELERVRLAAMAPEPDYDVHEERAALASEVDELDEDADIAILFDRLSEDQIGPMSAGP
jgi:hypothetical protein